MDKLLPSFTFQIQFAPLLKMVARRNGWLANDKTDGFYLDLGAFKPLAGRHP
jgi:hypothetical protein